MGIFTTALRNKKISQILTKNTSPYFHSALLVIRPHSKLKEIHFGESFFSRFSIYIRKTLMYVENLEILFLRAVENIRIQTLIISPWLLFCKMIISQLLAGAWAAFG